MTALAKLPLNQARQEVFDIVFKMIIIMRAQKASIVSTKSGRELLHREFTNLMNAHFVMNGAFNKIC